MISSDFLYVTAADWKRPSNFGQLGLAEAQHCTNPCHHVHSDDVQTGGSGSGTHVDSLVISSSLTAL